MSNELVSPDEMDGRMSSPRASAVTQLDQNASNSNGIGNNGNDGNGGGIDSTSISPNNEHINSDSKDNSLEIINHSNNLNLNNNHNNHNNHNNNNSDEDDEDYDIEGTAIIGTSGIGNIGGGGSISNLNRSHHHHHSVYQQQQQQQQPPQQQQQISTNRNHIGGNHHNGISNTNTNTLRRRHNSTSMLVNSNTTNSNNIGIGIHQQQNINQHHSSSSYGDWTRNSNQNNLNNNNNSNIGGQHSRTGSPPSIIGDNMSENSSQPPVVPLQRSKSRPELPLSSHGVVGGPIQLNGIISNSNSNLNNSGTITPGPYMGASSRYSNLSFWKARRVIFYRNGDPFFPGVELRYRPGRDITSLDNLLDKISPKIDLPRGARYVFSMDGDRKYNLDELEDGASYVVSSFKSFKVSKVVFYFILNYN